MTDYTWTGALSTDSLIAGNWSPSGVPGTGDNVFFDNDSTLDCVWTIPSINDINLESTTSTLIIDLASVTITGVFLFNGHFAIAGSQLSALLKFSGNDAVLIEYQQYALWVNGDSDKAKTTFEISGSFNNIMFENGEYPIVEINTTVSPHVPSAPNNPFTEVDFYQLTFTSGSKFAETSALVYSSNPKEERAKVFRIRSIGTWSSERFEGGKAIWLFYATTGGFELPLSGSNIAGSDSFEGKVAQIRVTATVIGQKIKVPPGPHYLEKLTIDTGVICICDREIAELHMTNRPVIDGAWQFVQIADGIYRSAKEDMILPISHGGTGQKNAQDAINALTQVSAATDEYVLTKDTTTGDAIWKAAAGGGGSSTLSGLTDTTITSAEEPQILVYDDALAGWINDTNDRLFIRVKNDTASTLLKGKAVYITGYQNANTAKVELAKADSAATMPAIGIMWADVAAGAEGYIVSFGKANGVAANFTAGDTLYVSPTTAGELTSTKPTSTSHLIQNVGILFKPDATNAVIKVTGIGRSNDVPNQFSIPGSITADGGFTSIGSASFGDTTVNGKLTVTGLIDPTGMEFAPVASNPGLIPANTLWLDSLDSNKLKLGLDEVGGDKLPTAGGTMTGEIEGTTITLNAVPADPQTGNKVRLGESGTSSNMLRIQTDAGYLDIGANNSGYAHFMTDRDRMYFNKPLIVDGGGYFLAYNDGLKLGTGTSVGGATVAIEAANGSPDITVAGTTTSTGFIKAGGLSTEYLMADGSVSTGGGGGGGTPSGAPGAIQFNGGGTFASDDANLHYDDGNNRLGVGTNTPQHTLHVDGTGDFPFRVQADEGNLRMNKYGHLHIQNDNSSPIDGDTIDSPLWHLGQRDNGVLDISFGSLSTQLVSLADSLIQMQRAGNSATGQKQIGFLGATPTGAIDDGFGAPLQPIFPTLPAPTPNESALAARLDAILAGLQSLGLFL